MSLTKVLEWLSRCCFALDPKLRHSTEQRINAVSVLLDAVSAAVVLNFVVTNYFTYTLPY